jgi:hypothetical protein
MRRRGGSGDQLVILPGTTNASLRAALSHTGKTSAIKIGRFIESAYQIEASLGI